MSDATVVLMLGLVLVGAIWLFRIDGGRGYDDDTTRRIAAEHRLEAHPHEHELPELATFAHLHPPARPPMDVDHRLVDPTDGAMVFRQWTLMQSTDVGDAPSYATAERSHFSAALVSLAAPSTPVLAFSDTWRRTADRSPLEVVGDDDARIVTERARQRLLDIPSHGYRDLCVIIVDDQMYVRTRLLKQPEHPQFLGWVRGLAAEIAVG